MSRKRKVKPYRLIGAYDSETSNVHVGKKRFAIPILHQLGILDTTLDNIDNSNVESHVHVNMYRHAIDLFQKLDELVYASFDYVPVIACHNLAFDMYSLSSWLSYHEVKVLAKSLRKPLTFTISVDGEPRLVIWDTLSFTQTSLDYMGRACGYEKLVGSWDYDLVRTPQTELTQQEIDYAKHDVYTLIAYLAYWCKLNPDIEPSLLARNVITKTGVVRQRKKARFAHLKGKNLKQSVGRYWMAMNAANAPKTDDELFTMVASTRGGFTFVSSENASVPFECGSDRVIVGYDATSQHPSQIVSHYYPVDFHKTSSRALQNAFEIVSKVMPDKMLSHYAKPFPCAFYAAFEVENLRPKKGSLFADLGILPFASARCGQYKIDDELLENNQDGETFKKFVSDTGYKDTVENPVFAYGKLVSADRCVLYLTELAAWELVQAYDYDSIKPVSGYISLRFRRPSDMSVLSVMNFYSAKNEFKKAIASYKAKRPLSNAKRLKELGIPDFVVDGMNDHTIDESIVEATYLNLKSDLNALFGIEATNEYRRDTIISNEGITYVGDFGLQNKPRTPKAHYQFGQRIVGWSRIAQILTMQLVYSHCETIINGDTDSIKLLVSREKLPAIDNALARLSCAIDQAKDDVCKRVKANYAQYYNPLNAIGYYVKEFETSYYCASWNKAYMMLDDGNVKFTIAGIPAKRGANQLATRLLKSGKTFSDVANLFLGYNVTYAHDLIRLFARKFPEWGNMVYEQVTDYKGDTYTVCEPDVLYLYPMAKTVNDTANVDNAVNMEIALSNNPDVNIEPVILSSYGDENGLLQLG